MNLGVERQRGLCFLALVDMLLKRQLPRCREVRETLLGELCEGHGVRMETRFVLDAFLALNDAFFACLLGQSGATKPADAPLRGFKRGQVLRNELTHSVLFTRVERSLV